MSLSRRTILLAADFLEENLWAVVSIMDPKGRRRFVFRQFALVESAPLAEWLSWFFAGLPASTLLFSGSATDLTSILRQCLRMLGLEPATFSLRCFRAGGATHAYRTERNLGVLQFAGRWKTTATLHHYIQSAMVALQAAAIPQEARPGVEAFASLFRSIKAPPQEVLTNGDAEHRHAFK